MRSKDSEMELFAQSEVQTPATSTSTNLPVTPNSISQPWRTSGSFNSSSSGGGVPALTARSLRPLLQVAHKILLPCCSEQSRFQTFNCPTRARTNKVMVKLDDQEFVFFF